MPPGDLLGSEPRDRVGDTFGRGGLALGRPPPEPRTGLGDIGTAGLGGGGGTATAFGRGASPGTIGPPGPTVRFGAVTATGGSAEVARRVLGRQGAAFRDCYVRELARRPGLAGSLTLRLATDAEGRTTDASITGSTLPPNEVGPCIAGAARSALFPAPEAAAGWTVTLPLTLSPGT